MAIRLCIFLFIDELNFYKKKNNAFKAKIYNININF